MTLVRTSLRTAVVLFVMYSLNQTLPQLYSLWTYDYTDKTVLPNFYSNAYTQSLLYVGNIHCNHYQKVTKITETSI